MHGKFIKNMSNTAQNTRQLVDTYFSLQWCRENIVVPIGVEPNSTSNSQKLTIAIGNFSYLGTIGDFIKGRVSNAGLECQFIEKEGVQTYFAHRIHKDLHYDWVRDVVGQLSDDVYITVDVDGFDPSIIPGTGTPEPFGINTWEYDYLISEIVRAGKQIVGFDFNELSPLAGSVVSEYTCARLIYRTLGRIFKEENNAR